MEMGANKKTSELTLEEIWEIVKFVGKFKEYGIEVESVIKLMDEQRELVR